MTQTSHNKALEDYLSSITLTQTQSDRIESALKRLSALMLTAYGDPEIYTQGSYATDTMVKPLTDAQSDGNAGEFDVDIVIERDWDGAKDSLESIATTIENDGSYANMPIDKTKGSCVRIDYADDASGVGFHVDVVPTRVTDGGREVPERDEDDWKSSDAKSFADWFNAKCEAQPNLRKVAVIIKRLRDINGQADNLKSITVLSLVSEHYIDNGSLMNDLMGAMDGIQARLSESSPTIANPVNPGEDLLEGVKDMSELKRFVNDTTASLDTAIANDDSSALEEIFGAGYTAPVPTDNTKATAAIPLAAPTRAYGITENKR